MHTTTFFSNWCAHIQTDIRKKVYMQTKAENDNLKQKKKKKQHITFVTNWFEFQTLKSTEANVTKECAHNQMTINELTIKAKINEISCKVTQIKRDCFFFLLFIIQLVSTKLSTANVFFMIMIPQINWFRFKFWSVR